MANNLLVCGDSIAQFYNTWATGYATAKGYTKNNDPTVNSTPTAPALSSTTLQNYDTSNGLNNFLSHFTARCGTYCNSLTVLAVEFGINDFFPMYQGILPTAGTTIIPEMWRQAWTALNADIVALGANKPVSVYVFGLPVINGSVNGLVRGNSYPGMYGDWMTARMLMDKITERACLDYGWKFVGLRGMTLDMLVDVRHPNQVGQNYFLSQWLAAG